MSVATSSAGGSAARAVSTRRPPVVGLRIELALVVCLAVITLWAISVPGSYFLVLMVTPMLWLVLGIAWLALAIITVRRAGVVASATDRYLLVTAAIAAGTIGAVVTEAPLHARVALSRSAMEAVGVELADPGISELPDRSIGLFDAESISEFAGGYRFLVAGTGFLDPVGFAYSPAGRPPDIGGEDWYIHYDGPWWIWVESW